jgi:predicted methyltransferase
MKVAELAPGGGYFTRLLSAAVGPRGKVYAVSARPLPWLEAWNAKHNNATAPGNSKLQITSCHASNE